MKTRKKNKEKQVALDLEKHDWDWPCNCGHTKVQHLHGSASYTEEPRLSYCKEQWDRTCECDCYTPLDNLSYMQWVEEQHTKLLKRFGGGDEKNIEKV